MSHDNLTPLEMCNTHGCIRRALANGYCDQHQEGQPPFEAVDTPAFSSVPEEEPTPAPAGSVDTTHTDHRVPDDHNPWPTIISAAALIILIAGIIAGIWSISVLNDADANVPQLGITNADKIRVFIYAVFVTGTVALVLQALSEIIKLLDKISKK